MRSTLRRQNSPRKTLNYSQLQACNRGGARVKRYNAPCEKCPEIVFKDAVEHAVTHAMRPAVKKLVILISGRGSNMEALLAAQDAGRLNAGIAAVISNRADAKGLDTARARGIAALAVPHRDYASREAFDAALMQMIDAHSPDLVVLAGFMRILTPAFVQHYAGRLINIHPSLLPAFPGLDTHARALAAGCKVHGATVHFVTSELDHGPIVIQAAVPVLASDDAASLAARVLRQEHVIYPRAVRWFVEGRLRVEDGIVRVGASDSTSQSSTSRSSATQSSATPGASQLIFQDA